MSTIKKISEFRQHAKHGISELTTHMLFDNEGNPVLEISLIKTRDSVDSPAKTHISTRPFNQLYSCEWKKSGANSLEQLMCNHE